MLHQTPRAFAVSLICKVAMGLSE